MKKFKWLMLLFFLVVAMSGCTSVKFGVLKKAELAGADTSISARTEMAVAPAADDIVPIYDTSATMGKRILISNLFGYLGAAYDTEAELAALFDARCLESVFGTSLGAGLTNVGGVLTPTDASVTNEIEVVDEAFSDANFNGGTASAVSQDDFYDLWHGIDTDDDGDIDVIDSVVWATKQDYDADLDTWAGITPSANVQAFNSAANYAAMRSLLGVLKEASTAFTESDTTPDVSGGHAFITANGAAVTISGFDWGGGSAVDGDTKFVIVNDSDVTFDFTSSSLAGLEADYTAYNGELLIFKYSSTTTKWHYLGFPKVLSNIALSGM
ncbi:MAG: hypothetical protein M0R06_00165, partial [Sphaerochaeta sp.]|nr:hypothetical protein [Sphaerochaeta sp.]